MKEKIILAITGASGSLYVVEFLKIMRALEVEVHGIISASGEKVLGIELGKTGQDLDYVSQWFEVGDFTAPMASGSSLYKAMVVLPCTMGSLSSIANGNSNNLIHRAADVCLKERRKLILSVRETPFNRVHLNNMLLADGAGAIICPAMPAFYLRPDSITDLARDYAARVVSLMGFEVPDMRRWGGEGTAVVG